jgi:hypothetical protein
MNTGSRPCCSPSDVPWSCISLHHSDECSTPAMPNAALAAERDAPHHNTVLDSSGCIGDLLDMRGAAALPISTRWVYRTENSTSACSTKYKLDNRATGRQPQPISTKAVLTTHAGARASHVQTTQHSIAAQHPVCVIRGQALGAHRAHC